MMNANKKPELRVVAQTPRQHFKTITQRHNDDITDLLRLQALSKRPA